MSKNRTRKKRGGLIAGLAGAGLAVALTLGGASPASALFISPYDDAQCVWIVNEARKLLEESKDLRTTPARRAQITKELQNLGRNWNDVCVKDHGLISKYVPKEAPAPDAYTTDPRNRVTTEFQKAIVALTQPAG